MCWLVGPQTQSGHFVKKPRYRRGFSLIEALVVVSVLGLLASGAMLVLSGPLQRAKQQSMLTELAALDEWSRVHSRRGRVEMQFDLSAQTVSVGAPSRPSEGKLVPLGAGLRIAEVLIRGTARDSGVVELRYAAGGCPTHALLMRSRTGQPTWTIVSGPTGERYRLKSDEEVDKQLRAWFTYWTHPD